MEIRKETRWERDYPPSCYQGRPSRNLSTARCCHSSSSYSSYSSSSTSYFFYSSYSSSLSSTFLIPACSFAVLRHPRRFYCRLSPPCHHHAPSDPTVSTL